MDVTTAPNLWSIAGMLYALAGAGLLWNGFGVMMHHQDASHPVTDVSSKRLAASQIFDGRAGAALIAVGSFLQASGAVSSPHMNKVAVLVLFALIGALLWYLGMKDLIIARKHADPTAVSATPEFTHRPALEAPHRPALIAAAAPVAAITAEPIDLDDVRAAAQRHRT